MSMFRKMIRDWPFLMFVVAFFFAVASLISGELILLGLGLLFAVIGSILEKKVSKK